MINCDQLWSIETDHYLLKDNLLYLYSYITYTFVPNSRSEAGLLPRSANHFCLPVDLMKENFFRDLAAIEDKIWSLLKLHGYDNRGAGMSKILMGTIWSLPPSPGWSRVTSCAIIMVRVRYIICKKNWGDKSPPPQYVPAALMIAFLLVSACSTIILLW